MGFWIQKHILLKHYIVLAVLLVFLSACTSVNTDVNATPTPEIPGEAERGQQLILNYGCGACHTIPGIVGADTEVGPPLANFSERRIIAGQLVNTPENLVTWIMNPQVIHSNTSMPDMGVTTADAQDIVAYLYTLD